VKHKQVFSPFYHTSRAV